MRLMCILVIFVSTFLIAGCSSRHLQCASSLADSGKIKEGGPLLIVKGDAWIAARDICNKLQLGSETITFENAISQIGVDPNPMIGNIYAWVFSEQGSDRVQVLYVSIATDAHGDRVLDHAHWDYKP